MNPSEEISGQDSEEERLKPIRGGMDNGGDSKGELDYGIRIRGNDVRDSCGNRRRH